MMIAGMWKRLGLVLGVGVLMVCPSQVLAQPANGVNGVLDTNFYGSAVAVQTVQTQFGDNFSELNAAYARVSGDTLYLMLTGNLEGNFNKLNIFIDSISGGQNVISGPSNPNNDGWASGHAGMQFDSGFEADYLFILRNGAGRFYLDYALIGGGTTDFDSYEDIFGGFQEGSGTTGSGANLGFSFLVGFNNSNTAGISGGTGAADQAAALAVTTGIELGIPLAAIGNPAIGAEIKISAMINGSSHNYLSNQTLGGLPPPQGNLGGDGAGTFTGSLSGINFANFAGNQYFIINNIDTSKSDQTIDFPPISDQIATNTVGLAATATSGLPVTFDVLAGPGQITGDTNLSFTGAGTVSVVASQDGDSNWHPAPSVTNTFEVLGVYTVTVVSAHGVSEPVPGEYTHIQGTILTNTVITPDVQGTTQYVATGWTLTGHEPASGSGTQVVFAVTNSTVLTWIWDTQYWLATQSGPNGTVDIASSWQDADSEVEITAQPDAYYAFDAWSGSVSSSDNPLNLLMNQSKSVTAHFTPLLTSNHPTPHWWLAQYGITNDLENAVGEDPDGDGVATWKEYVMDTDPTDSNSYLRVTGLSTLFGTNCWEVVVTNSLPPFTVSTNIVCDIIGWEYTWPASTNRVYDVEYADTLAGDHWQPVPGLTNIVPTGESVTITNLLDGEELRNIRVRVRTP